MVAVNYSESQVAAALAVEQLWSIQARELYATWRERGNLTADELAEARSLVAGGRRAQAADVLVADEPSADDAIQPEEPAAKPTRKLVTRKGVEVETDLTDAEALAGLRELTGNTFAARLLQGYRQYGSLTHDQNVWAHKLALEARGRKGAEPLTGFAGVSSVFSTAGSRLKYPKIELDRDGVQLRLSKAGPRSRRPGVINVVSGRHGGRAGDGRYLGYIDTEGSLHAYATPEAEINLLRDFAADPAGVAGECGRKSGRCCFCLRSLTDPASVKHGYGETCAEHYGLEYSRK